jgi:hypothetical protein
MPSRTIVVSVPTTVGALSSLPYGFELTPAQPVSRTVNAIAIPHMQDFITCLDYWFVRVWPQYLGIYFLSAEIEG